MLNDGFMIELKMKSKISYVCASLLIHVLMSGCTGGGNVSVGREVAVSVPPLEYFVKAIGGDSVGVTSLMGAGSDPETFQPGMGVMRSVNRSGVLMVTGVLPFEAEMLGNVMSNTPGLQVCNLGDGIEYIYGTHGHGGMEHEGEPDPHIWSSVGNARVIASNTYRYLSDVYPELEPYFNGRYRLLETRLDSLDRDYGQRLADHPAFVIWHPALSYFARDYGLEQIAFNIENKESTPQRLRHVTEHARGHRPEAFFVPAGIVPERVAALSDGIGIPPTEVNFMSADWEIEMNAIVDALTKD